LGCRRSLIKKPALFFPNVFSPMCTTFIYGLRLLMTNSAAEAVERPDRMKRG
jgi:hypothetical protein